ncbi:MAG: protein kinase [Myxococcota bacterium]|nr:protein kinase [Myxococcota bacterium]
MVVEPELEPDVGEPQPAALAKGRRLGRYVLCYELASGGMATVYLGRTEGPSGFGRLVALKVIHPHLAKQQEFVEMFLDEARIASRIVHPNVCSVFDYGEEEGAYYLAMDYLVGENAGRVMRAVARNPEIAARPSTYGAMARIVADACEGLHAAHELRDDDGQLMNLVHRDVTPHNVFVGYDGSVRVVDFGVALATGRTHHTTAGTLKGKFPYMSPEQIAREDVDRRSDVWSLGVCLWELLVRRRLFRRDSEYQTLQAVTAAPVPPPSEIRPGVPPVFDAIVARALERDPSRRYRSAREMGRDLNAALGALGGATSADVAELMDELFADARAERAALLDKARRIDPEQPSTSKISRIMEHQTGSAVASVPLPAPETSGRSRRTIGIAAGVLAVVGIAIAGAVTMSQSGSTGDGETGAGETSFAQPTAAPPIEAPTTEASTAAAEPTAEPEPARGGARIAAAPAEIAREAEPDSEATAMQARSSSRSRGTPRASRARSEQAAPAGVGTVNFVTPPGWAEIFVDGERVGRSPTAIRLPAGRHAVRLIPYGDGEPITRSVEVSADQISRLVVRLDAPE